MMRIILFLLTNLAVLLVLSISLRLLGVDPRSLLGMLVVAAVIGMTGALISLALSKTLAKAAVQAKVIAQPTDKQQRWLLATVAKLAKEAQIGMPEVAIYQAPDINAFATGMRRNAALVAVSSGLLEQMRDAEVEAVLAHEISHIANGDMVTMALLQGVVNTFVVFLSNLIGSLVDKRVSQGQGHGPAYHLTRLVAELVLGVLASIIVMWFSRQREFRADAGAARLVGAQAMVNALQRLQLAHTLPLPSAVSAFGIAAPAPKGGWRALFLSHPPLAVRIEALQRLAR